MSVEVSRATLNDAIDLAMRMRAEDVEEVRALTGQTPRESLEASLAFSGSRAWTVRCNGKIMGIWGLVDVSLINGTVLVWCLTSHVVDRYPKEFMRASKKAVEHVRAHFEFAFNRVDARYVRALRWLRHLGFEVQEPIDGFCLAILRGA